MGPRLETQQGQLGVLGAALLLLAVGLLALGHAAERLAVAPGDADVARAVQRNNLPLPTGVDWSLVAQRVADVRATALAATDPMLVPASTTEACPCAGSDAAQVDLLRERELVVRGRYPAVVAVGSVEVLRGDEDGAPLAVAMDVVVEHAEQTVVDADGDVVARWPAQTLTERWVLQRSSARASWRLHELTTARRSLVAVLADTVTVAGHQAPTTRG